MALIKCTECGKEFSNKAESCPHCGCPIDKMEMHASDIEEKATQAFVEDKTTTVKEKKKPNVKIIVGVIVFIIIACVAIFFATANSRKYSAANREYSEQNFKPALEKYVSLGDYKDSEKQAEKCRYELTIDGQFMRAMSEGLMERWDKNSVGEDPDAYADFCQTELDKISKFYDETFDNKELGADVKTYIDLLKEAKDATKYYTVDYNTYSTRWADVYAKRSVLLQKFINEYGLTVDEAHQDTLDGLMRDAEAAAEQSKAKEEIQKMADSFKLVESSDDWGYKSYKIQMKNTTDMKFEYLYTEISVGDENGKIIDTGTSDQVTDWGPGQEAELDAYLDGQSKEEFTIEGKTIKFKPRYSSGTMYE